MCKTERCLTQPKKDGCFAAYAFTPSLCCLTPKRIRHEFSLMDRAKLLLRVLRGYYVYYQTDGERMVSYCFIKRNYLHKYAFLQKNDVLINPYYVAPDYRGQGLGGQLIDMAFNDRNTPWQRVYAVVKKENLPSIRTLEKLRFAQVGYSEKRGWSHRLTKQRTDLLVFCRNRTEN